MGLIHSPKIVTDGLVLALDAGNVKSYPGSGTTWYDKSGNGNNGTLTNGPTFSSANGGSIVFDGVDDYVRINGEDLSFPASSSDFTLEVYVKSSDLGSNNDVFIQQEDLNGTGRTWLNVINYSFGSYLGGNNLIISNLTTTSQPYQVMIKYQSGTLYIGYNGQWTDSDVRNIDENSTGDILIGTSKGNLYPFLGNIYNVKIYNRTLSAQEVLQNYNATKGRFGL